MGMDEAVIMGYLKVLSKGSLLRHYATSRKVTSLGPDEVEFFQST
jgi:hypothetical protein